MFLEKIQQENDIKKINSNALPILAAEIRKFLLDKISMTGGHLASNLGVVELTIALHYCFDLPEDKIIWDVGHQSYTHKILTGRKNDFDTLRQFGGMSGFPKRKESSCDAFDTGHSSTSISAGVGLATARDVKGESFHVVSVIGDGSMTGGMAYEAMNNAAHLKKNFIIILNDNEMSIAKNVGGISNYLGSIRTGERYIDLKQNVESGLRKIPMCGDKIVYQIRRTKSTVKSFFINGMLFEELGLTYLGPVDGHDIGKLCKTFQEAKRYPGPVLIHVKTKKGKGYHPAEQNPSAFHGTDPFDVETGQAKKKKTGISYTAVFSKKLVEIGKRNPDVFAITAAMPGGTGLSEFQKEFPKRFADVGIAEEHAVTFAAGIAAGGLKPVVALYSSFLQRAYDQVVHDVCMQNLPVVFCIDRAGLVGNDGETHQGVFDLSFLSTIPNMTILAPKNRYELEDMLEFAIAYDGPIAIRYPRGSAWEGMETFREPVVLGKSEVLSRGGEIALLAVGSMVETAKKVQEKLLERGIKSTLVNARFVKPLDEEMLREISGSHSILVTMEENVKNGGFGEQVNDHLISWGRRNKILNIALPDLFIEHGDTNLLRKKYEIDADAVTGRILKLL